MRSIKDSVYTEFIADIERRGIGNYFEVVKDEIRCPYSGGKVIFSGIKSSQKKLESQALKAFADFDAAWLEEADAVSKESWDALIPTMRKAGSEIWVSFNPGDPLAETYKRFVTQRVYPDYLDGKRYCISKKINYTDNPRFPEELRVDMELMKAADYESYRHIYLGEPVSNHELAIIKPAWIEAAIDAHVKLGIVPTGGRLGGFDVADEGPDTNTFIGRRGILVDHCEEWRDQDPNTAARRVFLEAIRLGMDSVQYDNIGVGAGAKGAIREEQEKCSIKVRQPDFVGFTASASVDRPEAEYMPGKKNEDMFLNLKAQAWWTLGDRFRATYDALQGKPFDPENIVSLDSRLPHLDKLCAELSQPRREFSNGKVKVESKDSMKKRGVVSPNLADACVMAFAPMKKFSLAGLL